MQQHYVLLYEPNLRHIKAADGENTTEAIDKMNYFKAQELGCKPS